MIDFAKLAAPFPPEQISWRIGSTTADKTRGMALAYLDARDVMDRLDAICGPDGWQCKYSHAGQKTICDIGIKTNRGGFRDGTSTFDPAEWVWKADGAGDSDIEAEKGALSDSFKRAAVRWGIGRYLYHLPSPWVQIEQKGRTSVIAEHEYAKLEAILAKVGTPQTKALPPAADPDALAGATRWVSESQGFLNSVSEEADALAWNKKNAAALKKLKGVSEDLYLKVMDTYGMALERARAHL